MTQVFVAVEVSFSCEELNTNRTVRVRMKLEKFRSFDKRINELQEDLLDSITPPTREQDG